MTILRKLLYPVFLLPILFLFFLSAPTQNLYAIDAERSVLDNGLILIHSEKNNLPIVKISLLIKASLADEPLSKAGIANLTADMITEGTTNRTSEEISEEIEFMGAGLSASAGVDFTTLSLSILKKDLTKGFEIFTDVLLNPLFPEKELDREKRLIKGSLKQSEESPSFLANRAFIESVYGNHPYGRLIEGTQISIDTITRDDLKTFYTKYYRPSNSIMAVVGDIGKSDLNKIVNTYLSEWKSATKIKKKEIAFDKVPKGDEIFIQRELTQSTIILGHIGIKRDDPDYYPLSVMNYILGGGGFSSRLMEQIRDNMGLTYGIYSHFAAKKFGGSFRITVQTKNENNDTVIQEILSQIKKIKNEPVSDNELIDSKSYLTGSFPRRIETMDRIADFLVVTEFYGLGLNYDEKYLDYINSITKEDIQRVAKTHLDDKNYILVVVGGSNKK